MAGFFSNQGKLPKVESSVSTISFTNPSSANSDKRRLNYAVFLKKGGVIFLTALSSIFFWLVTAHGFQIINQGNASESAVILTIVLFILSLCVFLSLLGIGAILIGGRWPYRIALLAVHLGALIGLGLGVWQAIIVLLLMAATFYWTVVVSHEKRSRVEIKILYIFRRGFGLMLNVLILMVAASLYFSLATSLSQQQYIDKIHYFSTQGVHWVFSQVLRSPPGYDKPLQSYRPEMSVKEFISILLDHPYLGDRFRNLIQSNPAVGLPPGTRIPDELLIESTLVLLNETLSEPIDSSSRMDSVVEKAVSVYLTDNMERIQMIVPFALIFGGFVILKVASIIYILLVFLLAWIWWRLALLSGIAQIKARPVLVEEIIV